MRFVKIQPSIFTWIFFFGLCIRAALALSRTDSFWPDEHFQSLEPASLVVFGRAYLSWEWQTGYRTWTIPGLYIPILFISKVLGITGGVEIIYLCRLFTALISSLVLIGVNRVLLYLEVKDLARNTATLLLAFWPAMVLWAPSTLSDNWAMISVWLLLPWILRKSISQKPQDWFWMGVMVGSTFLIRFQMAFWILGLGLTFLILKIHWRLLVLASLGCFCNLLFLGVLDYLTWGKAFSSLIAQYERGMSVAKFYGTAPWYEYFPKVLENQGLPLFLILLVLFLFGLIRKWPGYFKLLISRNSKHPGATWVIFFPLLLMFIGHSLIDHKETRFLLPIFPSFFCLIGLLLHPLIAKKPRIRFQENGLAFVIALASLSGLSFWKSFVTPVYLSSVNITSLESLIYRDRGLSPDGTSCVLLVNHHWSFTRGQLILGQKVDWIEREVDKIPVEKFYQCTYAIVPVQLRVLFEWKAQNQWKPMAESSTGYVPYKNKEKQS